MSDGCDVARWMENQPRENDQPAASAGYALGDKVRLLSDIWDDGEDHHPPGYLAMKGEVLVVRTVKPNFLYISHEHITDRSFQVNMDEIERA